MRLTNCTRLPRLRDTESSKHYHKHLKLEDGSFDKETFVQPRILRRLRLLDDDKPPLRIILDAVKNLAFLFFSTYAEVSLRSGAMARDCAN